MWRVMLQTNVGQTLTTAGEQWIQEGVDQAIPDLVEHEEDELDDAENGRNEPHVTYGQEGKANSPADGAWESQEQGQETVDPSASSGEDQVAQTPGEIEAVRGLRLGNDIVKLDVDVVVDTLVIPFEYAETSGESGEWRRSTDAWNSALLRRCGVALFVLLLFGCRVGLLVAVLTLLQFNLLGMLSLVTVLVEQGHVGFVQVGLASSLLRISHC